MANKSISDMSESELNELIRVKEKGYKDAIKAKKVFWEVKQIFLQKKKLESQLFRKGLRRTN